MGSCLLKEVHMNTVHKLGISFLAFVVLVLTVSLTLVNCGGGGGSAPPVAQLSLTVEPTYSEAANWNDYVSSAATSTACSGAETGGYSACIHGGENKSVAVTGETSCSGLTASDSLTAFTWNCDSSFDPVRMVTRGLKGGKFLSDLIDFAAAAWKHNSVTVYKNGRAIGSSPSAAWWSNPVIINNDGGSLNSAGTVYLVTAVPGSIPADYSYSFGADRIVLLVKPGFTLKGANSLGAVVSVNNRMFTWVEGKLNAATNSFGLSCSNVKFSVFKNIFVSGASGIGMQLSAVSGSIFSTLIVDNNGSEGITVSNSTSNLFSKVSAANNGQGVFITSQSKDNIFLDMTLFNNIVGVISNASGTSGNMLMNVTAANNASYGAYLIGSSYNTLTNINAVNNSSGIFFINSDNNTVANAAAAHNFNGVRLDTCSNSKFTGLLKVGNWGADCNVSGGAMPGLITSACTNTNASDAVLTTGITMASSFVSKVTATDLTNESNASGAKVFGNITDWISFANPYRGWGADGIAFPDASNAGQCSSGMTCRIWDWSLLETDSVVRSALILPTGNDVLLHTWTAANSTDCGKVPGAVWNAGDSICTSVFLKNAIEFMGDSTGNENGLCESGETCLYTPNIGSYQGHGSLVPAGSFSTGTLTGISLVNYQTNGY